jgi:hypothetical protein
METRHWRAVLGIPDLDPHVFGPPSDPESLVRGTDPRIRIRIRTKKLWYKVKYINIT